MAVFIGIDPGLTGAVATISEGGLATVRSVPVDGKSVHARELATVLEGAIFAVVEKVNGQPEWGSRNFTFGKTFGEIAATVELSLVPHQFVPPSLWKKRILVGTDRGKQAAIDYVKKKYPDIIVFEGKLTHDKAEAVCMAEYAKLLYEESLK